MGTNYYWIPPQEKLEVLKNEFLIEIKDSLSLNFINFSNIYDVLDTFKNYSKIHLGKKSNGWKFLFQLNDLKFYSNKETFRTFLRSGRIINEYGDIIEVDKFEEICFDLNNTLKSHQSLGNNFFIIDQLDFCNNTFS